MEMQEKILAFLEKSATGDTLALADLWKCDHQKIVGAVKSLECLDDVIKAEAKSSKKWEVTDEGKEVSLLLDAKLEWMLSTPPLE